MQSAFALFAAAPFAIGTVRAPAVPAARGVPLSAPQAVVVEAPSGGVITEGELFDRLARSAVVYAGEKHDEALHHGVQLELLRGLHARRPGLVLGLEMVDRESQGPLDDWLAGRMNDGDFAAFWKKAWGFDYALYAPLLSYAKANGIPVRGLNAPISLISKVYRGGLAALTPAERSRLPARVAPITDRDYLAYVTRALTEGHGEVSPERLARMLEAQQAWNETMGEGVLSALAGGAPLVLVVAGSGHMVFRSGIAESVNRRAALPQSVVLPWPDGGGRSPLPDLLRGLRDPAEGRLKLADFFWLLPS
ncbi:MAG: ChaN family lipoprotein [Elusimicrobia bacterium]|nr:ChaN family lipoprotein [Elusimicrobiota bacterium]